MDKASNTYKKKVNASTQNLAAIRSFVSKHAENHGFDPKQVSDIQLAVDEAYTNIIKHAYKNDPEKEVIIHLDFTDNKMTITLMDEGIGFDVKKYKKPHLKEQIEKKQRGGMGVFLIQKLMDDVSYHAKTHKNILRMSKNRD
ncbi:MAG: ATP-binding protein [Bacteroidetes bacterium]|nr:ATP-binding protein [Bacteroidota bacterium]